MTEDVASLTDDIIKFEVPTVPRFYDFSRPETPEEIAAREAFFTTGASRVYSYPPPPPSAVVNNENEHPTGLQPEFKVPTAPAPRSTAASSSSASGCSTARTAPSSSTETALEQIDAPNLAELAAFRGPRKPLRRSQLNSAGSNASQGSAGGSSLQSAAARAAERRRSASASRSTPSTEPDRRRSGSANRAAAPPAASAIRAPPAIPRVRTSSLTRPASRPVSTSSSTTSGGVQTRAMAAAASASAPRADGVAALTAGVARLNVARVGTPPANRRPAVGAAAAAANDRLSRPITRRPSAPSAASAAAVRVGGATTSRPTAAPIRVGAPLRAADRFLAETAAAASASGRAAGGAVATAAAPSPAAAPPRPNSALRKPTTSSIQRLAMPRARQSAGVPSTPKRFSTGLRAYPPDTKPANTLTIPDTPKFRVDRRASSHTRAPAASASEAAAAATGAQQPGSAPRAPVNLSRLVNRLSQPRPQRVAEAAGSTAAGDLSSSSLPPAHPRRLGTVPLGRTHGLPVVRRTTTNTQPVAVGGAAAAALRSRSNSAARSGAAGGVVQGAGALRGAGGAVAADAESTEQQ